MQTSIQNPRFTTKDVGKVIKGSKRVFVWEFSINDLLYRIEYFHSKVSNKRRINLNGNKILDTKEANKNFKFTFSNKENSFTIIQLNPTNFELLIDDFEFSRLSAAVPGPASVKQEIVDNGSSDNYIETNRQSIINDIFGSTTSTMNSKTDVRGDDEECKEVPCFDFVKLPQRSTSEKLNINLLNLEKESPKKKLNDMLSEIDFYSAQQIPKVEVPKDNKLQMKNSNVKFNNF